MVKISIVREITPFLRSCHIYVIVSFVAIESSMLKNTVTNEEKVSNPYRPLTSDDVYPQ